MKFHKNPSSECHTVPCRQAKRRDEPSSTIFALQMCLKMTMVKFFTDRTDLKDTVKTAVSEDL
jgi:hypothetical protein